MKKDNPFTVSFGFKPGTFISRPSDMEEIVSTFSTISPVSVTYLICGIRGCGKTVLLTSVEEELLKTGDWIAADLNATADLLDDMARRLEDSMGKGHSLNDAGFNVSLAGFGIGVSGSKAEKDSISRIEVLLEEAQKRNKRVLITIDEVKPSERMRVFANQFQIFRRKKYPVYLIMTGLYEDIDAIQNDSQLTFLLRSPRIALGPLSAYQIVNKYKAVFGMDEREAARLATITKGYAFAFQALGLLCWEYRGELSMEEILAKLDELLDGFAYRRIWSGLSEVEKSIVGNLTDHKTKVADIREKLSITSSSFAKYRERLMKKGLIESPEHGYITLTLPRFAYIARTYLALDNDL